MDKVNSVGLDGQEVNAKLDLILDKHFRRLDQIDAIGNDIQLSLTTVASLHLIVEKEYEILESKDIARYDRKAFISDLTELGFEINDDMIASFEKLHEHKYVKIDSGGKYRAEAVAITIVDNFNKMFPGMPGMNLVAYFIQTVDEILSNRKDLKKGLEQFDQALQSRGRALSFVFLKTEKKSAKQQAEDREKKLEEIKESRKASEQLKKTYGHKLNALRKSGMQNGGGLNVLTKRALGVGEINVKEISPQKIKAAKEKAEKARLEAEKLEHEKIEEERLELKRAEDERLEKERIEQERLELEAKKLEEKRLELEQLEIEQKEKAKLEAERVESERKENERLEMQRLENERIERERVEKELAIEAQIAAFEQEMASPCPICHIGKIISEKTAADKDFFKCSNTECKFISWTKPYPFSCPICNNPFLAEFTLPTGELGLKCPRASCSYSQNNLFSPIQAQQQAAGQQMGQPQAAPTPAPAKKRRLVRRRKR